MDSRLKEINLLLSEYSLGKFDKRLKISSRLDETDAIINGINMLGDELKSITISRDYFNNIFNSVSDMVFILNSKGIIEDANKPAEMQLQYKPGALIGKTIYDIHKGSDATYLKNLKKQLVKTNTILSNDDILYTSKNARIPVRINTSYFKRTDQGKQMIILTASDITFQKQTEKLIIRAIIDMQEKERERLAKDLHDTLTQELSAIKFYISTITELTRNQRQKALLIKSKEGLNSVIADMRNICFSLMPKILEEFGLVKAVEEFCNHFVYHKHADFLIRQQSELPVLSPELKIDMYRIIQEFINNAVNHGKADKVRIFFSHNRKNLKVILKDNGKGFDINLPHKGMGLQNVQSRVKSHNGALSITSVINKGTSNIITIPLND